MIVRNKSLISSCDKQILYINFVQAFCFGLLYNFFSNVSIETMQLSLLLVTWIFCKNLNSDQLLIFFVYRRICNENYELSILRLLFLLLISLIVFINTYISHSIRRYRWCLLLLLLLTLFYYYYYYYYYKYYYSNYF